MAKTIKDIHIETLLETPFTELSDDGIAELKRTWGIYNKERLDNTSSLFGFRQASTYRKQQMNFHGKLSAKIETKLWMVGQPMHLKHQRMHDVKDLLPQWPLKWLPTATLFDRERKALLELAESNPLAVYAPVFHYRWKKKDADTQLEILLIELLQHVFKGGGNEMATELSQILDDRSPEQKAIDLSQRAAKR